MKAGLNAHSVFLWNDFGETFSVHWISALPGLVVLPWYSIGMHMAAISNGSCDRWLPYITCFHVFLQVSGWSKPTTEPCDPEINMRFYNKIA